MAAEERVQGPPHGILLAVVVGLVVSAPLLVGDGGEKMSASFSDALNPAGLFFLPLALLLLIRFLSSEPGGLLNEIFSSASRDSIHRVGGSPLGVALFLLLTCVLLSNRSSIFRVNDDSGDH